MKAKKTTHTEQPSTFDTPIVPEKEQRKFSLQKKTVIIIGIILTTFFILCIILYYYIQYQNAQKLLKNPMLASEVMQESIVSRVGKLTQLPTEEQPTIAKVSDITKLQGQPFFQKAKNGDYVLIYPKAKEAILYDPVANKIVQVGPISVNQPSPQALGDQTVALPIHIAIENGTTVAGLAKKTEQKLMQTMPELIVVSETNAVKQDYTQTVVIDLSGKQSVMAAQLAKQLGGIVSSLPSGEVKPAGADILVILGETITPTP